MSKIKNFAKIFVIVFIIIVILIGIVRSINRGYEKTFFALDTVITIKAYGKNANNGIKSAEKVIRELESQLTEYNENSEIFKLNESKGVKPFKVSENVYNILLKSKEVSGKTNGKFDITIKPLVDLWDIKNATTPPSEKDIEIARAKVGYNSLILSDGMVSFAFPDTQIDLGGIAKGYIGDRVIEEMKKAGVTKAIVDLGGNVMVLGEAKKGVPFRVGIRDPRSKDDAITSILVKDKAVVTSGGYERYFEYNGKTYHHILDPATGYPSNSGLLSVTVVADNGMTADALSTAMFIEGRDEAIKLAKEFSVDIILVMQDGSIYSSIEGVK